MSNDSGHPGRDSLSREVDRLLRQLHPAAADAAPPVPVTKPTTVPVAAPSTTRSTAAVPAPTSRPAALPPPRPRRPDSDFSAPVRPAPRAVPAAPLPADVAPTPLGVWSRVTLGAVLAGAMTQWPYAVCGLPLIGYLVGAAMVLVAGGWAALVAWHARMGRAHVLAITLIFAGSALVAHQVLPRLGYAPVETHWRCSR